MNKLSLKPYFTFSKSERAGIFALLSLIIISQAAFLCIDFSSAESQPENQEWLSLQTTIDSLKLEKINTKPTIYPFNPNFITDFKGYKLGMSVAEIDRLLEFRKQNKYVNSAAEFQALTLVSDSLLKTMAPYFKFPDWVKNKNSKTYVNNYQKFESAKKEKIVVTDINHASKDDLIKIYGIGPALSERILKQKEIFGGFVSMEQMQDVWGLSPEVIENLNKYFKVSAIPDVKKIRINDASVKELSQFPYFRYALAKQIVTYRSMNGNIRKAEDLTNLKDFPADKINIIALYLEF